MIIKLGGYNVHTEDRTAYVAGIEAGDVIVAKKDGKGEWKLLTVKRVAYKFKSPMFISVEEEDRVRYNAVDCYKVLVLE